MVIYYQKECWLKMTQLIRTTESPLTPFKKLKPFHTNLLDTLSTWKIQKGHKKKNEIKITSQQKNTLK